MKKLLTGLLLLTLFTSVASFADEGTLRVRDCENDIMGIVSDMMSSSNLSIDDMLAVTSGPVVDKMLETCTLLDIAVKAKEIN